MTDRTKNALAGAAGGVVNGLFGGGGGMVLLPLLSRWGRLEEKKSFATCVAVILPMSCLSALIYVRQALPPWDLVLPCLLGALMGGILGGLTFRWVPVRALRIVCGIFMCWAGVRYLL